MHNGRKARSSRLGKPIHFKRRQLIQVFLNIPMVDWGDKKFSVTNSWNREEEADAASRVTSVKTDKELTIDLVGWLEYYVIRVSILEHLLTNSNVTDWRERAAYLAASQGARSLIHEQFALWRDTILTCPDVTAVAREILGSLSQQSPDF
jgi:hypothetical protein